MRTYQILLLIFCILFCAVVSIAVIHNCYDKYIAAEVNCVGAPTHIDTISRNFADYIASKYKYIIFDFDKTIINCNSLLSIPFLQSGERLKVNNPEFFQYLLLRTPPSAHIIIASNNPRADLIRKVLNENFLFSSRIEIINGVYVSGLSDLGIIPQTITESAGIPRFSFSSKKQDIFKRIRAKYPDCNGLSAVFFDDMQRNSAACESVDGGDRGCNFINVSVSPGGAFSPEAIGGYFPQLS